MKVIATVEFELEDVEFNLEAIMEALNEAFIENWTPEVSDSVKSWKFLKVEIPT